MTTLESLRMIFMTLRVRSTASTSMCTNRNEVLARTDLRSLLDGEL